MKKLRNIAIIAHVDHGKTTLVDKLLQGSGTVASVAQGERLMDSNELEKERGITILAKNTAINWKDHHINIVDTPGHADFGGEVERILSMVDSVLLLVDAVDGPMPQTRFVTQKAFAQGLNPILVINKIDREGARPDWVLDQVFELFANLDATDEQLDFPVIYTSALQGIAKLKLEDASDNIIPLLDAIIDLVPAPDVDVDGSLQMQISALDYSSYVGVIGIGRITRGSMQRNMPVMVIDKDGNTKRGKLVQILGYLGLERNEVETAVAGDIVAITGISELNISDTICAIDKVEALPALAIDEPTVSMNFQVNDSPFTGNDGKLLTSRQIQERLDKELIHNVALKVERDPVTDNFKVSGRGELHLSILIETMRREGFELAVSRPVVVVKEIDGVLSEPFETVTVDIQEEHQGSIMEALAARAGDLNNMHPDGKGRIRLDYMMPSRGLIGFYTNFLGMTSGTGLLYHTFDHFGPCKKTTVEHRKNGVMVSNAKGKATGFSLWNLQERGKMLIGPQTEVYEGMLIGINSRDNDLVVNVIKGKQLTNVRASGTDENITLTPHIKFSLEQALSFIDDDELVEITPVNIRLRKKLLLESARKSSGRKKS